MRRRMLLVIALLMVLAAACGGDEGSVFSTGAGATTTTRAGSTTTAGATTTTASTTSTTRATTTTVGNADQLVDLFASQLVDPDTPFDEEAANCVATGVVEEMGYERLVSLGAGDPDAASADVFAQMTEDEISTVADVALGCLDMPALFVEQFIAAGLPEAVSICIADGMAGAPFVHDMLVDAMLGGVVDPMNYPEAMTLITSLVTQCMGG